ncbi:MAG: hypothetical protein IJ611_07405 [Bacteroidales bacterium]|nr:hypothetical protein [Bacteroidales bacterium]
MKKFMTILACMLLLPSVAFGASDKKDDKKGGKGGKDTKGGSPVIVINGGDWLPIFHAVE